MFKLIKVEIIRLLLNVFEFLIVALSTIISVLAYAGIVIFVLYVFWLFASNF